MEILCDKLVEELKRFDKIKNRKEMTDFFMIIYSFCYITGGKEVSKKLIDTLSNMEFDVITTMTYLSLVTSISQNKNNAYKLKSQVRKIFDLAVDQFDYSTSISALALIVNAINEKEGSLNSLPLSQDDLNLIWDDIERFSYLLDNSETFKINNYLYASIFAIGVAIPYSLLRSSLRLVPGRGFSNALPLIGQSVARATLGSGSNFYNI